MPHWIVCFWTGSGPVLEKSDLGTEGGQQLVTIILQVPLGPHWGGGGGRTCVSGSSYSDFVQSEVSHEEKTPVGKNLYQPISTTAWLRKAARHSTHRRSVSGLGLCLRGSSASSLLLIVTHLAARHDWAVWRRPEVEEMIKSSRCKLVCSHSFAVI